MVWPDNISMGKELVQMGDVSDRDMRNREIQRLRRQRVGMYWFAGVCAFLTVGAVLVISYAGNDLAWLTNTLLVLSPAWIVTGALAVLVGVGAIAMNYEIDAAVEAAVRAAQLKQAYHEEK